MIRTAFRQIFGNGFVFRCLLWVMTIAVFLVVAVAIYQASEYAQHQSVERLLLTRGIDVARKPTLLTKSVKDFSRWLNLPPIRNETWGRVVEIHDVSRRHSTKAVQHLSDFDVELLSGIQSLQILDLRASTISPEGLVSILETNPNLRELAWAGDLTPVVLEAVAKHPRIEFLLLSGSTVKHMQPAETWLVDLSLWNLPRYPKRIAFECTFEKSDSAEKFLRLKQILKKKQCLLFDGYEFWY